MTQTVRRLTAVLLCGLFWAGVAASHAPVQAQVIRQVTRLTTPLVGKAIRGLVPSGIAEFVLELEVQPPVTKVVRTFTAQVQDVRLPAGSILGVFVNTTRVGSITLGPPPAMSGLLTLDTRLGQVVPLMHPGDRVTITAPNGIAILSGMF